MADIRDRKRQRRQQAPTPSPPPNNIINYDEEWSEEEWLLHRSVELKTNILTSVIALLEENDETTTTLDLTVFPDVCIVRLFDRLLRALYRNRVLEELVLKLPASLPHEQGIARLAAVLLRRGQHSHGRPPQQRLPTLRRLDLRNSTHAIGEYGAVILANALRSNSVLTVLSLRNCDVGVVGSNALADALRRHPSLLEVDFGRNRTMLAIIDSFGRCLCDGRSLGAVADGSNHVVREIDFDHDVDCGGFLDGGVDDNSDDDDDDDDDDNRQGASSVSPASAAELRLDAKRAFYRSLASNQLGPVQARREKIVQHIRDHPKSVAQENLKRSVVPLALEMVSMECSLGTMFEVLRSMPYVTD